MKPGGDLPEPWHDQGRRTASHGRNRGPRKVPQATTAPQGQKGGAPLRSAHGKPAGATPVSPHSARATVDRQISDTRARPSSAPTHGGRARRPRAPKMPSHDNAATTTTNANLLILSGLAAPDIGISGTPRIQPSEGRDAAPRAGHGRGGTRSRARGRKEDDTSTGTLSASRPSKDQQPGAEGVDSAPAAPVPRGAPQVPSGGEGKRKLASAPKEKASLPSPPHRPP